MNCLVSYLAQNPKIQAKPNILANGIRTIEILEDFLRVVWLDK